MGEWDLAVKFAGRPCRRYAATDAGALDVPRKDTAALLEREHSDVGCAGETYNEEALVDDGELMKAVAAVQTSRTDANKDGTADSVHVEITTPLSTNETIRQATVAVVLDYTLKVCVERLLGFLEML
ncbi:unnamed protein product [Phytophthora fragariaefolia]|uniref:Unnamed protein product n=1 Tax=Phytophthora fragariaefolia TaxID=1490495 RepID=A0A9W6TPM5_9STRA|nr:unnamed protein product [Phytophthora fragariaefolia]